MTESWQRARSDFNHGWLKNRFIALMHRCRRVAEGAVLDANTPEDLRSGLLQWTRQRAIAEGVLIEVEAKLVSEAFHVAESELPAVRVARHANEAERLLWVQREQPELAVASSRRGIAEMDLEIDEALRRLTSAHDGGEVDIDRALVERLLSAADRLADAFSRLTIPQTVGHET